MKNKGNGKQNNTGRLKALKIAVPVIAALAALVVAFLLLKNTFFYNIAKAKIDDNQFKSAQSYLQNIDTEKADVLGKYADLRIDINSRYASLLAGFDITMVEEWKTAADEILAEADLLPEDTAEDASALSERLSLVSSLYYEYTGMEPEISDMMDIFGEINRLYTKDSTGENIAFTVQEENAKNDAWEKENDDLIDFSGRLPEGDSVYLLSYLIKETQGECDDLRTAMNNIIANGFTETDTVRVNGDAHKSYPSVSNTDGVSVNVADKETYLQYLNSGIMRALAESLSAYYIGI